MGVAGVPGALQWVSGVYFRRYLVRLRSQKRFRESQECLREVKLNQAHTMNIPFFTNHLSFGLPAIPAVYNFWRGSMR